MNDTSKHYKALFKKYGVDAKSVQWSDKESQYKRFEALLEVENNILSIIDLGCGFGDLYEYLKLKNFNGKYLGLDNVDEFIDAAKERFSDTNTEFKKFDINTSEIPKGYDYIILSGVFNNKFDGNYDFMINTINEMFKQCEKGIAFNAMSSYVDYQADNLYYSNPLEIFDYCKIHLTRKVILKHDYIVKEGSIPFEYTMFLYK